eukprot:6212087-Pleurochrysis_carterae.AAC.3
MMTTSMTKATATTIRTAKPVLRKKTSGSAQQKAKSRARTTTGCNWDSETKRESSSSLADSMDKCSNNNASCAEDGLEVEAEAAGQVPGGTTAHTAVCTEEPAAPNRPKRQRAKVDRFA